MSHQINIGEVAPDFVLHDHTGEKRNLSNLCSAQPLALFLERHLG